MMKRCPRTLCRRLLYLILGFTGGYLILRSYFGQTEDIVVSPPTSSDAGDQCFGENLSCEPGTLGLTFLTESRYSSPNVCYNNRRLFEENKLLKGFNIAVLNENSQAVESIHYISFIDGDRDFIQCLSDIPNYRILVIVSYSDVASKLSNEGRHLLAQFGASFLDNYIPGSSLLMVGQRGLVTSSAIEKVSSLNIPVAEHFGKCIVIPMGRLSDLEHGTPVFHRLEETRKSKLTAIKSEKMDIKYGDEMKDCGNLKPCGKDEIAMYFYSGKNKDDAPKICVNGRFIIDRGLNDAGRGLNAVVLDVKTRQVLRVGHFDTYDQDDTGFISFLEQLTNEELIAVVSFDEAATRLSETSKKILYELGSSLIEGIKFRASWYFVGQKGIDSFSTFEEMFIPSGNDWARPVDVSVCVPLNLNSYKPSKTFRTVERTNSARRHFCEKYDGYGDFCKEDRLDTILTPRMLKNRSRSTQPVFSLPILVAGGLNRNSIRLCLESMLNQEGISMHNVIVSFDFAYPEVAELAALFHARSVPIMNATSYNDFVLKSISQVMDMYPSSPSIIVVEEDVLLSSDFLIFIDRMLESFSMDETANVIHLFNKNAFTQTASLLSAVYRFENSTFTKAFVIKRYTFASYMSEKAKCCPSIDQWLLPGISYVPDVSRVSLIESGIDTHLFLENKRRRSSPRSDGVATLSFNSMMEVPYDKELKQLIIDSKKIYLHEIADCQTGTVLSSPVARLKLVSGQPFAVVFHMSSGSLAVLFRCFHLGEDISYGIYKGVVRFSVEEHFALLVDSKSFLYTSVKKLIN